MSTRASIKYDVDEETGCGFHLYEDMADSLREDDNREPPPPIYLELMGVNFEVAYAIHHGGSVMVAIPRDWAEKLGLVKPPNDRHKRADTAQEGTR